MQGGGRCEGGGPINCLSNIIMAIIEKGHEVLRGQRSLDFWEISCLLIDIF